MRCRWAFPAMPEAMRAVAWGMGKSSRLVAECGRLVELCSSRRLAVRPAKGGAPGMWLCAAARTCCFMRAHGPVHGWRARVAAVTWIWRSVDVGEPGYEVPELLDPASGRVDAARVAAWLDVSLDDVAAVVEQPVGVVRADPAAPAFQERLGDVAIVLGGLLALLGGERELALIWLSAPHPDLDGDSPLHLMRGGELAVVVDLIDDALSGAPA